MQKEIIHLNFAKGFRGGERQTIILARELSSAGYKQKLIVRTGSPMAQLASDIEHLQVIEISKPYWLYLFKVKGAGLLHAHETKAAQFAYLAHLLFNKPYIVTRRVDHDIRQNVFNKSLYTNAEYCVSLSQAIQKTIFPVAANARHVVIPSAYCKVAVDVAKVKIIRDKFSDKYLVGHVGELINVHKGQNYIIEAARLLEDSHPSIHFLLIGDGCDADKLKAQARGLSNITFVGFVENVIDYMHVLDVFVFPSLYEGLGSTLMDAMLANKPIVASNVGGIPELIDDTKSGILVKPRDVQSIVDGILNYYNNSELAEKYALSALQQVENYSPEKMAERYIDIYNSI